MTRQSSTQTSFFMWKDKLITSIVGDMRHDICNQKSLTLKRKESYKAVQDRRLFLSESLVLH